MKNSENTRNLIVGAQGFFLVAELIINHRDDLDEFPWPAYLANISYCLELSMKAFIASRGATEKQLKAISHNLETAYSESREMGLNEIGEEACDLIRIVNKYHNETGWGSFRYIKDQEYEVPDFGQALILTRSILSAIAKQIPIQAIGES